MRKSLSVFLSLWLIASTLPVAAQETELHPFLKNGLFVDAGVFFATRDVQISVNGTTGVANEEFDIEETFGTGDDDEAFALELGWRYGEKWSLSGQFFKISASTNTTLLTEVEFEDEVFPVGANVDFGSSITITRVFFGRQFKVPRENAEFGIGGGFHWLSLFTALEGQALAPGGTTEFASEVVRAEGPMPNIGAWYRYSFSPRLAFRLRFDWMDASVDKYDGRLINIGTGLNYAFTKHLGAGINYNYLSFRAGVTDDWRGTIDSEYRGIFVNLTGYF